MSDRNNLNKTKSHATTAPQYSANDNSISYDLYRQLRADIMTCKLKPNQRLRIDVLKSEYGAAVGTLREALTLLASDGLVRSEFGRGVSVAPVSVTDLHDVTDWRVKYEVQAIADSIRNGDDQWEVEVVASYYLFAKSALPSLGAPAEEWLTYSEKHSRFHDSLVAACGSPWLLYFRRALVAQAQRYQALAYHHPDAKVYRGDEDHKVIMDAVMDRNEKLACELIESHIRRTTDIVVHELSGSGSSSAKFFADINHQ